MRNIIDRSRAVYTLPVLVVVGIGVWAAIHAVPADRRPEGSVENSNAGVDVLAVRKEAGASASLENLVGELRYCRTAVGWLEETRRSSGPAPRDALGRKGNERRELQGPVDLCTGAVYVWSTSMPLSGRGIVEISEATRDLGIAVQVLDAAELYAHPDSKLGGSPRGESTDVEDDLERELTAELIAKGVTVHYPAIMVYRDGRFLGDAIVGYKTAGAYEALIAKRLAIRTAEGEIETGESMPRAPSRAAVRPDVAATAADDRIIPGADEGSMVEDLPVTGRPGPYFRFVPGRGAIAFESGGVIYLLDLASGSTQIAPGFVDFVPGPDGRFFVTPAEHRRGLEFYAAGEVFGAAAHREGARVLPFYVDREMRDQYPSVGVLDGDRKAGAPQFVYRVLTSWFDKVVFRDYDIRLVAGEPPTVRPLAEPVVACPNLQISLPIMAPDGRELAARDEATATTKIFRLSDDGTCTERLDTGLQTGKVAWAADGRRVAFAIPQGVMSDGRGALWRGIDRGGELAGIFVLDRDDLRLIRVPGGEEVDRLAFPEFVGRDSVMFLLTSSERDSSSLFRLTCCAR